MSRRGGIITYWRKQTVSERKLLASKLRQAREKAGLTQRDAANRLGIPQSIISELENGQRRLDVAELVSLAALYSLQPTWFLEGHGEAQAELVLEGDGPEGDGGGR